KEADPIYRTSGRTENDVTARNLQGQRIWQNTAHTHSVNELDISPDGNTLASVGFDHTMRFWDAATGRLRTTVESKDEFFYSVAFSSNGKNLATLGCKPRGTSTIKVWDAANGREVLALPARETSMQPHAIALSPDGKTLAHIGWSRFNFMDVA